MTNASTAIKLQQRAARKRIYAPSYDPIRADMDLGEAAALDRDAAALLAPQEVLQMGSGGEIVPPMALGMPGVEHALRRPDMLNLEASIQRTDLAERAGVMELALDTADSAKAKGSVQKMITHQMAAAHRHAMKLLADSEGQKDPMVRIKLINTSVRLMEATSRAALTLQRLQTGASQTVVVQHVQVNGQAVIGNVTGAR